MSSLVRLPPACEDYVTPSQADDELRDGPAFLEEVSGQHCFGYQLPEVQGTCMGSSAVLDEAGWQGERAFTPEARTLSDLNVACRIARLVVTL